MKRLSRVVLAVLVASTLLLRVSAQAPSAVYLPLVQQPAVPTPAAVSLQIIGTYAMPFETYNGVQPSAVQGASGYWYIAVYRVGDDETGAWIVRWREGEPVVTVGSAARANRLSVAPVPDGPYSDARGTIACSRDGRIYQFSWQGSSKPKLVVGKLMGDTC